jgi:phage gp36-like protein
VAYATQQDMTDRYGEPRILQLTDREDPPAGVIDATLLQRRLDDATAVIDGYLVGRYALPLTVAPAILKVHCCSLTMYTLLGESADKDSAAAQDKRDALAYLEKVARGDIALLPPEVVSQQAGAGTVLFSPGQKVMGRDEANVSAGGTSSRDWF